MEKEDSKLQSQTCSLPVADGRTELGVLPVLSGMNEKKNKKPLALPGTSAVCSRSHQMRRDQL